jgi:hypothetical protein
MSNSEGRKESLPGWLVDDELTREWLEYVREYREGCDLEDRQRILNDTKDGGTETDIWDK